MNLVSAEIVEEWVTFQAGENALEGILAYPDHQAPREAALLLSPHPHLGGRMDNNLITALAHDLALLRLRCADAPSLDRRGRGSHARGTAQKVVV